MGCACLPAGPRPCLARSGPRLQLRLVVRLLARRVRGRAPAAVGLRCLPAPAVRGPARSCTRGPACSCACCSCTGAVPRPCLGCCGVGRLPLPPGP
eukprot:2440386-Alexandrium_andersonii.AAC.1